MASKFGRNQNKFLQEKKDDSKPGYEIWQIDNLVGDLVLCGISLKNTTKIKT